MKLYELIKTDNEKLNNIEITAITCNSAKVSAGSLFICINGTRFDGHTFAADAIDKGAAAVVCERDLGLYKQIIVEDTHKAYFEISANWFGNPAKKLKLIGVTGTNGKTSVTYMLKKILEKAGHKVGLIGTIQNIIIDNVMPSKNTTPDAYEMNYLLCDMVKAGCEYVVMEVSSHALDQKRICSVEFEATLFTNLTQDHLDYHITMDNYFAAKLKLFKMSKCAVVNFDDEYSSRILDAVTCKKITYSVRDDGATYTAKDAEYKPDGVKYQMVGYNFINKIVVGTGGKFTVYNSMCAAATALELGVPMHIIKSALAEMNGVAGRAEVVKTERDFTVVIDYAHTPDGLENILMTFRDYKDSRLVVLFGCGGDRDKTKRPLMGEIAAKIADYVIVTSDNPRSENPSWIIEDIMVGVKKHKTPYKVIENRVDAIKFAIANARKDDIIILAGKGHETYQILNTGTIHLDEREVVREALSE